MAYLAFLKSLVMLQCERLVRPGGIIPLTRLNGKPLPNDMLGIDAVFSADLSAASLFPAILLMFSSSPAPFEFESVGSCARTFFMCSLLNM